MTESNTLRTLYRQTVLEHSREPQNFRCIEKPDRVAHGHNPLCGDKVVIYMQVDGDRISDIAFEGAGCAISVASASIMTETLTGISLDEAIHEADEVVRFFDAPTADVIPLDGKIAALGGVREYPSRIRCATLAWKTAAAASQDQPQTVTTE